MKKMLALTAILILAATTSFADVTSGVKGTLALTDAGTGLELHGSSGAASLTTALIGKNSTGVGTAWATDPNGYALMTQHRSGTKAYGTSYDSTALYQTMVDAVPGNAAFASGVLNNTDTTDFSDATKWKAM